MNQLINPYDILPINLRDSEEETALSVYGRQKSWTVKCLLRDAMVLTTLFPFTHISLRGERGKKYPAIRTIKTSGGPYDLYLRRGVATLWKMGEGKPLPADYVVRSKNLKSPHIRPSDLLIVPNPLMKHPDTGEIIPCVNSHMTRTLIRIRLRAVLEGRCPDEAINILARKNQGGASNVSL